jgi:hypothetical protein
MMIKAIVFVTWWQSVGISALVTLGLIKSTAVEYSDAEVATGLQVCGCARGGAGKCRGAPFVTSTKSSVHALLTRIF